MVVAAGGAFGEETPLARADFEGGETTGWTFTDPKAWRIGTDGDNKVLELFKGSKYQPKVRSPLNIALLDEPKVGDFVLEVRLKSTKPDYGHRDLCLFFGHQDPEHFYYVHLGKKADPHSNAIFLVNGSPRVSIAKTTTKGTPWTDDWHQVRLVRDVASGKIEVYFDDMTTPAMTATDTTLGEGKIGVGSFDDIGMFDDIELRQSK